MSMFSNAGFPINIFKSLIDRLDDVEDDVAENTEDITTLNSDVSALKNSLRNWVKTQTITVSCTQNGYTMQTVEGSNLTIPSGYTFIGMVIMNNTNPTKVVPTYSIKYESSKYRTFVYFENFSDSNALTTQVKLNAIYLKNAITS